MIDWNQMSQLHVIKKIEEIICKWFGVEMFLVDHRGEIFGSIKENDHDFYNDFLKIQINSKFGMKCLQQDIEKTIKDLSKTTYYNSPFKGIRGMASPIFIDQEFKGAIFVAPYTPHSFAPDERDVVYKQLLDLGAKEESAKMAINALVPLSLKNKERLEELMELVTNEIISFHKEITKRDERITELNNSLGSRYRFHNIIGRSKKMQLVYHLLEKIQKSESTVLIQGDNGTGKELVAKAIHYQSPRKDRICIAQNCSAFNDNLLDSELFGHVKGSFTGAIKDKKGLFEMANGGTLFLDEIGDTSMNMQVKLLRVLQEGTFLPVGATQPKKVDVRVVAATNRPLKEMIEKGEFREDLYYRINVINVSLPPLRERQEDISLLSESFLEQQCAEAGLPPKSLSPKTLERMLDYRWPGNVRELQNEIERMVVLAADEKIITPDMLSPRILSDSQTGFAAKGINTQGNLKQAIEELETMMIREGLKECDFNKSKLAKKLGISRAGLIIKVDKYGLQGKKKTA